MLIIGNKEYGLAKSLYKIYPDAIFLSRSSGYNLGKHEVRDNVASMSLEHDFVLLVKPMTYVIDFGGISYTA